jgi:transcriptional regulator with XRE-family HTH domain
MATPYAAIVRQCKPHSCGTTKNMPMRYHAYMVPEQRPIAEWMRDVIARRGISARQWAERAGMGKDTVSRAVRDDYQNVTTVRTIIKLSDALNEPPPGSASTIPSVESLSEIVQVIADMAAKRQPGAATIRILAEALRETLLALADRPADARTVDVPRALARAAVRRIVEPTATQ